MKRGPRARRVDRARGRDLGRGGVLRRRDGDDRARLAGGGGYPAGHDDGSDGGDRGGRRGARRADADAGGARDRWGRASTPCACAPCTRVRAKDGLWAKWANDIAKRPLLAGLAALAILLPLTIPLLSLNLGQQDIAALSTSTTARRAYDLISANFGPGVNGPLIVAVSLGSPGERAPVDPRLQTLQKDVCVDGRGRGGDADADRQGRHDRATSTRSHDRPGGESHRRTSSNDCVEA